MSSPLRLDIGLSFLLRRASPSVTDRARRELIAVDAPSDPTASAGTIMAAIWRVGKAPHTVYRTFRGSGGAGRAAAPWVLGRGGSGTSAGECHVRDSAGRGGGLDPVVVLEAPQALPDPHAPAEQDRDHHDVHMVDEPGSKEVADHGGTSAEAYVLAVRGLAGCLERLGRRSVDEVERRAALHLDRRAWVMGEDEYRCVERRVGTPRALPLRVLLPAGRAELAGTHDLGAAPRIEQLREGVVDAAATTWVVEPAPPPGGEHPFVQPIP